MYLLIYHNFSQNVGKYAIHGWYGYKELYQDVYIYNLLLVDDLCQTRSPLESVCVFRPKRPKVSWHIAPQIRAENTFTSKYLLGGGFKYYLLFSHIFFKQRVETTN